MPTSDHCCATVGSQVFWLVIPPFSSSGVGPVYVVLDSPTIDLGYVNQTLVTCVYSPQRTITTWRPTPLEFQFSVKSLIMQQLHYLVGRPLQRQSLSFQG